jgi:hypothetical protein
MSAAGAKSERTFFALRAHCRRAACAPSNLRSIGARSGHDFLGSSRLAPSHTTANQLFETVPDLLRMRPGRAVKVNLRYSGEDHLGERVVQ